MGRSEPTPTPPEFPPARPGPPAEVQGTLGAPLAERGRWRVIALALTLTAVVAFALTRGGETDPRDRDQARADSETAAPTDPSPGPQPQCPGDATTPAPSEPSQSVPAATADYYFQGSLESSLGTAPDLIKVEEGSSVFTADGSTGVTVLRFAGGRGLALAPTTNVIPSSGYSIEVLFRFDHLDGFRKVIDFKNGSTGDGLYVLDGCLTFVPKEQEALTRIGSDSYVQVVLTRDAAARVVGYVDGVRQFAFHDRGDLAKVSGSGSLRFFVDDVTTTQEWSSGAVSQIRLFDQALTANEVALLACTELAIADPSFPCHGLER
jgi:hypothetical protein